MPCTLMADTEKAFNTIAKHHCKIISKTKKQQNLTSSAAVHQRTPTIYGNRSVHITYYTFQRFQMAIVQAVVFVVIEDNIKCHFF